MKSLKNYNNYIFDILLEENITVPLYFSDNLKKLLLDVNSPISDRLLSNENNLETNMIAIDIDYTTNDKITFIMTNKLKDIKMNDSPHYINYNTNGDEILKDYPNINDYVKKDLFSVKTKLKTSMLVGKFINKLYNKEYTSENNPKNAQLLIDFLIGFKAYREPGVMELVSGDDISYWYDNSIYTSDDDGGALLGSCMGDAEYCSGFFDVYTENKNVSMLIMYEDDTKNHISGRAIVWKLDYPENRVYMDRIYTADQHDVGHFINYAKKEGWLYKKHQNMKSEEGIVDTVDNSVNETQLLVVGGIEQEHYYPYMDTMSAFVKNDGFLLNVINRVYDTKYEYLIKKPVIYLKETNGGPNNSKDDEIILQQTEIILENIDEYIIEYNSYEFWNDIDNDKFIKEYTKNLADADFDEWTTIYDSNYDYDLRAYILDYVSEKIYKPYILKYMEIENEDVEDDDKIEYDKELLDNLENDDLINIIDDNDSVYDFIHKLIKKNYISYTAEDVFNDLGFDDLDDDDYKDNSYYYNLFVDCLNKDEFANDIAIKYSREY